MDTISQLEDFSAALAVELASQLYPAAEVFNRHGLDDARAKALLANPVFRDMLKDAQRDWGAIKNVKGRLRAKARLALEESLVHLYAIVRSSTEPAAARVAAAKELKDIAGIGSDGEGGGGSGLPTIVIQLGDQAPPVTVTPGNMPRSRQITDAEYADVSPEPEESGGPEGEADFSESIPRVVF